MRQISKDRLNPGMKIQSKKIPSKKRIRQALVVACLVSATTMIGCSSSEPIADATATPTSTASPSSSPSADGHSGGGPAMAGPSSGAYGGSGSDSQSSGDIGGDPGQGMELEMGMGMGGPSGGGAHGGGGSSANPYGEDYMQGMSGSGIGPGMSGPGMSGPGMPAGDSPFGAAMGIAGLFGIDPSAIAATVGDSAGKAVERFPDDYGTQAELAFKQGYEKLAHELLIAHLATEPGLAKENYEQVKASAILKRPTWNLRWAMAIDLDTPEDFDGNIDPVVVGMRGNGNAGAGMGGRGGRGGRGGGRGGRGGGMGAPGGSGGMMGGIGGMNGAAKKTVNLTGSTDEIDGVLGLFADVVGQNFDQRFANGDYGTVFSGYALPIKPAETNQGPGQGMAGMGMGMGGMSMGGMVGGLGEGDGEGMMGSGMGGMPGMGAGSGTRTEKPRAFDQADANNPRWRPGMVYLGPAKLNDAIKQAESAGANVLVFFEVNIENAANDEVRNTTRARVVLVSDPKKTFATTKKLTNEEVKRRNPDGEADPRAMVEEAVEPMFADLDRKLALVDFPAMTADGAKAQISSLLGNNSLKPLDALAQIQLYRHLDLITEEELLTAAELLLGDDGLKLIAADIQIQREVADTLQTRLKEFGEIGLPDPAELAARNQGQGTGGMGMGGMGMGGMGMGMGGMGMGPGGLSGGPGGLSGGSGGMGMEPGGKGAGGADSGGPGDGAHDQ